MTEQKDIQMLKQKLLNNGVLDVLIDNPYEGIVVVDKQGYIRLINNTYLEMLGLNIEDAMGKHIADVTSHTKLPQVIESGRTILYDFWEVNGRKFIVLRIPIINDDGEIIGAIGKSLYADMTSGKLLAKKLRQLEKELEFYKAEFKKFHKAKYTFDNIIGESEKIKEIKN